MNDSSKYILTFTKQFISVYIINTFKNNDNPMIKYIFTFIHKYTNEELKNIINSKIDDPINISSIINKRQWKELLNIK